MRLRLRPQSRRNVQLIIAFTIMFVMVVSGTNLRVINLNPRVMIVLIVLAAVGVTFSKRWRDANLLTSPIDWGWLALILSSGLGAIFAASPRRSLEIWVFSIAIQFPLAYGALYLLRRKWPGEMVYRAIFGVGAYVYLLATIFTGAYFIDALAASAAGASLPRFRLWSVLDNPAILGMFIAITAPIAVSRLLASTTRLTRILLAVWLIGAAIATFANATRSTFLATTAGVAVAIFMALFIHPRRPIHRLFAWVNARRVIAIPIAMLLMLVGLGGVSIIVHLQSRAPGHAPASARVDLYEIALTGFAERPLAGHGPGGFIPIQQQEHSVPPFLIVPHVHNWFLNTAAEQGIIGLLGLAIFMIGAMRLSWMVWQAQPEQRHRIVAAIVGLVGFLAASVLDMPASQPGLFFIGITLLMFIASRLPAPEKAPVWRVGLIIVPMLVIAVVALTLLILYSRLWQAIPGSDVDFGDNPEAWARVGEQMDDLHQLDPGDPLAILQSAYAWGRAALLTGDPIARANAIDRFERGIPLDADFSLHRLNLAALYAADGQTNKALHAVSQAVDQAPRDCVVWFNFGLQLEASGELGDAQAAYVEAMGLSPPLVQIGFWHTTETRQAALDQYRAQEPSRRQRYYDFLYAGDRALATGSTEDAITAYQNALDVASEGGIPNGAIYRDVAEARLLQASGDLDAARTLLGDATTVIGNDPLAIDVQFYVGDLARERDEITAMVDHYANAYGLLTSRGVKGISSAGDTTYSIFSFWRFGLVSDYLPGVAIPEISSTHAERLMLLAEWLVADGNVSGAEQVYKAILQAHPDHEVAQAALAALATLD